MTLRWNYLTKKICWYESSGERALSPLRSSILFFSRFQPQTYAPAYNIVHAYETEVKKQN